MSRQLVRSVVLAIVVSGVVVCPCALMAGKRSGCKPLDTSRRAMATAHAKRASAVPGNVPFELVDTWTDPETCYQRLRFSTQAPAEPFSVTFYLSPDRRFLVRELIDISVDLQEQDQMTDLALRQYVRANDVPVLGVPDAAIRLVLFADFQCPYCAQASYILTKQILPSRNDLQLAFVQLPLSIHSWARRAAEAAQCAYQEGPTHFWRLHEFLYANQHSIDAGNIDRKITEFLTTVEGVDTARYKTCIAERRGAAKVDQDIALAQRYKINSTPTLFINGQPVAGIKNAEQIETLMREISPLRNVGRALHVKN